MEIQPSDPNPMPEIVALPRLQRVAEFVKRLVHFLPEQPLASHGDHIPSGK
jgi:hypothetical protein